MKYIAHSSTGFPNPLRKIAALAATAALLGLALTFSIVAIAAILVAGATAWAYLWWQTRRLRRLMRNPPPPGMMRENTAAGEEAIRGEVIEGEVIRVEIQRGEK